MPVSGVGTGTIVSMSGGDHNTIGGLTLKNSNANAVSMAGGKQNKIIGCDMYDVGGHIAAAGGDETVEQLMADPTLASSNLIASECRDGRLCPADCCRDSDSTVCFFQTTR